MDAPELNTEEQTTELSIVPRPEPAPADYAPLYAKIAAVMGDVQRVEKNDEVTLNRGGYKVPKIVFVYISKQIRGVGW